MRNILDKIYVMIVVIILLLQTVSFCVQKYSEVSTINNSFIFGLFGNNFLSIFFSILILLLIIILENKKIISNNSFVLVVAGAISNIVDRLIYGGSVDYISILNYPTFNLADVLIVIGCLILILEMMKSNIYKKSP